MKKVSLFCLLVMAIMISACSNNSNKGTKRTDTKTSGFATIVSEGCFAPIIDEEIVVFEALNKDASINALYTGEAQAFDMLMRDSVRMIIAARDLTQKEKDIISSNNRQLRPRSQKIAYDGIALIVNKENTDTLMSMTTLKKIMTGEITSWKQINPTSKYNNIEVFFDNPGSSTVRYIKDSICGDKPLYDGLRAQKSNQDVLDMVSKTPNALGVIGVNWVSNPSDTLRLSFIDKITVMSMSRAEVPTYENSYKPFAAYLALNEYPLKREVYVILTDLRETLPAGFVQFIAGDRGQRIILKAGLLPATRPTRLISVKESFE